MIAFSNAMRLEIAASHISTPRPLFISSPQSFFAARLAISASASFMRSRTYESLYAPFSTAITRRPSSRSWRNSLSVSCTIGRTKMLLAFVLRHHVPGGKPSGYGKRLNFHGHSVGHFWRWTDPPFEFPPPVHPLLLNIYLQGFIAIAGAAALQFAIFVMHYHSLRSCRH